MKNRLGLLFLGCLCYCCENDRSRITYEKNIKGALNEMTIEDQLGLGRNYYLSYYDSGSINSIISFDQFGRQDVAQYFYPNGKIELISSYRNDSLHGKQYHYYRNGILHDDKNFDMGVLVEHKQYNRDGSIRGHVLSPLNISTEELFRKIWYYNTEGIVDSVNTIVYPQISIINDQLDDTFGIQYTLPISNDYFTDTIFLLDYKIDFYDSDVIISSLSSKKIDFDNKYFIFDLAIPDDVDSMWITCFVHNSDITDQVCSQWVKLTVIEEK